VFSARKQIYAPGVTPTDFDRYKLAVAAGAEEQDIATGEQEDWLTIGPWLKSQNPGRIDIVYAVLKWPVDASRSRARVEAALRNEHPELFQPSAPEVEHVVTVFMNDDGTISRFNDQVLQMGEGIPLNTESPERFHAIGLSNAVLGRRASYASEGAAIVLYAWPRRAGEAVWDPETSVPKPQGREDTADDAAILARYFPDAAATPLAKGERRWILFGRDGRVWGTGQQTWAIGNGRSRTFVVNDAEIEARYPGTRVSEMYGSAGHQDQCLGASASERQQLRIACLWVMPDSSVTERAQVNFSQRPDLFLLAEVRTPVPQDFAFHLSAGLKLGTWTQSADRGCPKVPDFLPCRFQFQAILRSESEIELAIRFQHVDGSVESLPGTPVPLQYGSELTLPYRSREAAEFRELRVRVTRLGAASGDDR
jgi:hypothetical protein